MIQADMLAYRKPGEPMQLGLPKSYVHTIYQAIALCNVLVRIGTPEVAQLVANISSLYSPELEVGFTSACCSDHQVRKLFKQGLPVSHLTFALSSSPSSNKDMHQLKFSRERDPVSTASTFLAG